MTKKGNRPLAKKQKTIENDSDSDYGSDDIREKKKLESIATPGSLKPSKPNDSKLKKAESSSESSSDDDTDTPVATSVGNNSFIPLCIFCLECTLSYLISFFRQEETQHVD